MERLYALLAEPIPLRWSQLRTRLPRAIELPDPEGDPDDDEALFKRIDLVTRQELEAHLQTRKNALLLEIQELQLLGELYRGAVAAGCDSNTPVFAAIERQLGAHRSVVHTPSVPSSQGAQ